MSTCAGAALAHESPGERADATLRDLISSEALPPGSALDRERPDATGVIERAQPARRA